MDVGAVRVHDEDLIAAGRFTVNGKSISEGKKMMMQPGDVVVLETPGGGGYGAA